MLLNWTDKTAYVTACLDHSPLIVPYIIVDSYIYPSLSRIIHRCLCLEEHLLLADRSSLIRRIYLFLSDLLAFYVPYRFYWKLLLCSLLDNHSSSCIGQSI